MNWHELKTTNVLPPSTREIVWGAGLRWTFHERAWFGVIASLSDGRLLCRHELTWLRVGPAQAARDIIAKLDEWKIYKLAGGVYANAEMWPSDNSGNPSDSEAFYAWGLPLHKASPDRVNGLSCVRKWFDVREQRDKSHAPSLLIHPDCKQLIRTLPSMMSDSLNADDIERNPDEHPTIGLMNYLMSRPMPTLDIPEPLPGPGTWGHGLREMFQPSRGSALRDRFQYR